MAPAAPRPRRSAGGRSRRERADAARDHFFVAAPTIASKPSTGLSAGLNSNLAFFRGDEKTTHISSVSGGMRVSQKKQVLSGVRFSMFTADDRWFIQGDNRLSWTSQNTYGLGADTLPTGAENVKFNAFRLYETAYRNVRPHLFAGLGINVTTHSNIRPGDGVLSTFDQSAYVAYNDRHGFRDERQTSGGTSAGLLFDTRDNGINAQRGWLASAASSARSSTGSSAATRPGSSCISTCARTAS